MKKSELENGPMAKTNETPQWFEFNMQTGEVIPSRFNGGKADSVGTKTPSLKRPDSDYSRIIVIIREKPGSLATEIRDEFNKRHITEKTIETIGGKLGRLSAKKLLIGRPREGDAGKAVYFINEDEVDKASK